MKAQTALRSGIAVAAIAGALTLAQVDSQGTPQGACDHAPCTAQQYAAHILSLRDSGAWAEDSLRWRYFAVLEQEGLADAVVGVLINDDGCRVYEDLTFSGC